jgi:hypothetical protein
LIFIYITKNFFAFCAVVSFIFFGLLSNLEATAISFNYNVQTYGTMSIGVVGIEQLPVLKMVSDSAASANERAMIASKKLNQYIHSVKDVQKIQYKQDVSSNQFIAHYKDNVLFMITDADFLFGSVKKKHLLNNIRLRMQDVFLYQAELALRPSRDLVSGDVATAIDNSGESKQSESDFDSEIVSDKSDGADDVSAASGNVNDVSETELGKSSFMDRTFLGIKLVYLLASTVVLFVLVVGLVLFIVLRKRKKSKELKDPVDVEPKKDVVDDSKLENETNETENVAKNSDEVVDSVNDVDDKSLPVDKLNEDGEQTEAESDKTDS